MNDFLKPELAVLIPILLFIGMWFKKSPQVMNTRIPILLAIAGVLLALLWVLSTSTPFADIRAVYTAVWTAIIQGLLYAAAAVYSSQIVIQAKKEQK